MKYMHILIALTISNSLCASEQKQLDPFSAAHEQYNLSNWDKACTLYLTTFAKIDDGTIKKENIDPMALVKGYVNCGDVLYAQGAGAYNRGEKEIAKQLMLSACDLWSHRLGGRQFGRAPLNNEWDGSDLTGKTLVVYSERDGGAFGDTFYMTGLLRYVKEKGARVIFVPQKPLAKLYDKNHLPNALQTHYVDQVVLRSEELPQHDVAIYLWSILKYYLHDTAMEKAFPMKPCLSGMTLLDYGLITAISQRGIQLKKPPFLI